MAPGSPVLVPPLWLSLLQGCLNPAPYPVPMTCRVSWAWVARAGHRGPPARRVVLHVAGTCLGALLSIRVAWSSSGRDLGVTTASLTSFPDLSVSIKDTSQDTTQWMHTGHCPRPGDLGTNSPKHSGLLTSSRPGRKGAVSSTAGSGRGRPLIGQHGGAVMQAEVFNSVTLVFLWSGDIRQVQWRTFCSMPGLSSVDT